MTIDVASDVASLDSAWWKIMRGLELSGISLVRIDVDYYWCMDDAALYSLDATSIDWNLGQIYDDWGNLKRWIVEPRTIISYSFTCLSSVIRAIGDSVYFDVSSFSLGEYSTIGSLGHNGSLVIAIADLMRLWELFVAYLRNNRVESIVANIDTYWRISSTELYNCYAKPANLILRDADAAWSCLKMAERKNEEVNPEMFMCMSDVLRIIGDHLV
ncbi:MAG: hypothetical protein JST22_13350 [Bacteroidetes bacterium]|nr:hypothetical protein [Bacteroidota bacterium]